MQYPERHMKDGSIRVENPMFLQRLYSVQELACFSWHHMWASISQTFQVSWGQSLQNVLPFVSRIPYWVQCILRLSKESCKIHSKAQESYCHFEQKHPDVLLHLLDLNAPVLRHSKQVLYFADGIIQSN